MTDTGTQQTHTAESRWDLGRVLLALLLTPLAVALVWIALSTLWHWPQPVYRLTFGRVLVTLGACGVALTGCRLLFERRHAGLAAAGLFLPCLWVISFISFIGVITLPIAVILTLILIGVSRAAGGGLGESCALGLLVALALAVLLFAQPWSATVTCGNGGGSTSTRPFDGSGGGSSSSSGSAMVSETGGETRGTLGVGGEEYVYRCEGERLTEFRRVD